MSSARDWEFSRGAKRYRDTRTGRFITNATVTNLRNDLAMSREATIRGLAQMLGRGDLSIQRWELEMREAIKLTHGAEYVFGRGGFRQMDQSDWGRVGSIVKDQYQYLNGFSRDIASGRYNDAEGTLSVGAVEARATMYAGAGVYSFSVAREVSFPGLQLPCHPGDGGTPCLTNCRCSWRLAETQSEYRATWLLGSTEHCEGCSARATSFNPYTQAKAPVV